MSWSPQRRMATLSVDVQIESALWDTELEAERTVRDAIAAAAALAPADGEISVLLTDDAAVRTLNCDFRKIDKPTNVLSFPASAEERALCGSLGDLVICAAVVAHEAREQGKERVAHWAHMVVHGVLHLHGHDHQRPRAASAMERLEVEILGGFGYQNPYIPVISKVK
jgi:probable rRNA maturation factor